MPTSEELRAQLAMTELEEQLTEAKAAGVDPDELRDLKLRVREAREQYRASYRSPSDAVGDGTAEPASIEMTAGVQEGGK